MPTTIAHKLCDTQPTMSFALLRIQLIIPPMIPGNASAAFIPNFPSSDAKALSLLLTHSFKPFSSFGGGWPPPDATATPAPPPGNNKYPNGHPDSHEYGSDRNSLPSKQSSDLFT